jgi:hypothetical protein
MLKKIRNFQQLCNVGYLRFVNEANVDPVSL